MESILDAVIWASYERVFFCKLSRSRLTLHARYNLICKYLHGELGALHRTMGGDGNRL